MSNLQGKGESAKGAREPEPRGYRGACEEIGNLPVRAVLHEAEHQHLALGLGQASQGADHGPGEGHAFLNGLIAPLLE